MMNEQIKKRLLRTLTFSLIALCIGGGVGWIQVQTENARTVTKEGKPTETAIPMAGLNIGGPFSLTDHTGKAVTEKDYDERYKLIYFGFTYCPAVCPTELQKISRIMSALEKNDPAMAERVQPLFITVDPERDRVPVMKEYVGLFHPKLVGLTGTRPQINFVKKSYRIFATKVQDESQNDYTVDHSSFIYLMGPDNTLVSMYRMNDTADDVYEDLTARLMQP